MRDLPDIVRQITNVAQTHGGGLLFSADIEPVLTLPSFLGRESRRAPRRTPNLTTRRRGKRVQTWGDSAEAIRMLKRAHGVPCRPTDQPVDLWAPREVSHG